MATINIGASNAGDEFYRYKMPALQSKIEGRGNGIKTNVMNMVDVAKALGRPPSYTTKFFGCELGAQTKFDEASGLSIVNGAHETHKLSGLLEGFIKKFVQCGQCGNPETDIVVTKKEDIELQCKACGAVTRVDMRHKLCTFILKNPPVIKDKSKKRAPAQALRRAEKERIKEGEALDKAEKEAKKKSKGDKKEKSSKKSKKEEDKEEEEEEEESEEEEDGDDGVQWSTDTSAAAAAARAREQLTDNAASMVADIPSEADAAAAKLAAASLNGDKPAAAAAGGDEDEDDEADPLVAQLRAYAAAHSAAETADHLWTGVKAENTEHRMHILVNALLSDGAPLKAQLEKRAEYFRRAVRDAAAQGALLAALEMWLVEEAPELLKGLPVALKVLYDADVVEEGPLCAWFDNGAAAKKFGVSAADAKRVREKAFAFVDWLRNAEDEEEEDDE